MLDVYKGFYELDPEDHMGIVKYVDSNLLFLENKNNFAEYDDFYRFSQLIAKYVIGLENVGRYRQTIKFADLAIRRFDENLDQFDMDINEFIIYWSVLVSKGRSHYYLKDYNNSIAVFERLVTRDPDNDNLIQWLEFSRSKKRNSVNKYLYLSAVILFLFSVLDGYKENGIIFIKVGFLLLIAGLLNDYFGDKILKWIRKK